MRDYDPTTGSYLQPDPLGMVDGPNVYRYALANPMQYVDPRELFNRGLSDLDGTLFDPDPHTDTVDGGFGDIEIQRLAPDVAGMIGLAGVGLWLMLDGDTDNILPFPGPPTPESDNMDCEEEDDDDDDCVTRYQTLLLLYQVLIEASKQDVDLSVSAVRNYTKQAEDYNRDCVPKGYPALPVSIIF